MTAYSARQRREAAEWFMDIHDIDDPTPELLHRWTRWLEAAEGNRMAFQAVERAWHQIPETLDISTEQAGRWWTGTSFFKPVACAAALAVAAVAAVALWWLLGPLHSFSHPSSGEFSTRTSEHMDLALADGSRITLGARSRLAVDFTATARDVRLEGGEAFFTVRGDTQRPFNVYTSGGVITAIGTAFNVRAGGEWVTVAVTEGAISVSDAAGADESMARQLAPGEQLTIAVGPAGAMVSTLAPAVKQVDIAQPGRWREGWLVYRDEALRAVIADVARYTHRRISMAADLDPAVRFTGAVYKDSVVEWVEALPEVFPVRLVSSNEELRVMPLVSRKK